MIAFFFLSLLISGQDDVPGNGAAKAALGKLADRFRDVRVLSADMTQSRRTELLEKPITSSGKLYYRREPGRLVFHMTAPRRTEIHLDKTCYQVYRPDEKRLERMEFENEGIASRLLMVFQPRTEEIEKTFTVRAGKESGGEIEVRLDPMDEKVRRYFTGLTLLLAEADGTLKRITYTDAEGDEVRFNLSKLRVNPELPPETFDLKVPEGTRVLKHSVKLEK